MTVHDLLPTTPTSAAEGQPRVHWLGWAAYLGISWTWCIGMFLPVLLVRDYGFFGWLVFAIPNVVGAAAMGYVMNSRDRSQRVIDSHRLACVAFSFVTVIFHIFFASWFVRGELGRAAMPALVITAALVWFAGKGSLRRDVLLAVIALIISALIFGVLVIDEQSRATMVSNLDMALHAHRTLPLAAACLFGFAFCPYLDLTFHRARLETTDAEARSAFGVGFGVFFFAMILFTLWYARFLETTVPYPKFQIAMVLLLVVHVVVQSGYTCAVHLREVRKHVNAQLATVFLLLIFASVIFFAFFRVDRSMRYPSNLGELIYRCFMSFYGRMFPA
jgi:hypothetical protein